MHMCVRLGQSMTMSICSPVSCAKSQECRQNIDTNVHGPIGLAQIYLVLLPWPTYSRLSLHFIKFSCAKAIPARKVCTKQNVSPALTRRVVETPRKLQLVYVSEEMVQKWDYWDPLFWGPLHHFTLGKSAQMGRSHASLKHFLISLFASSCSLPFSHSMSCINLRWCSVGSQ